MPTDNGPRDLIKQAVDILLGANQNVRIYTLAPRSTGSVLVIEGTVIGLFVYDAANAQLVINNMHFTGEAPTGRSHDHIPFANIIEIQET